MVKEPVKGSVKTRLAKDIGEKRALELYRSFVLDIVRKVRKTRNDLSYGIYPRSGEQTIREWLKTEHRFMIQEGNDLGERQSSLLLKGFAEGADNCVLLSTDCPDLPLRYIEDTMEGLRYRDVVLGPARDGGYYMIGFRRGAFDPAFLSDMEWSNEHVFDKVKKRSKEKGRTILELPYWWDVDDGHDLEMLIERLREGGDAPHTRERLVKLGMI